MFTVFYLEEVVDVHIPKLDKSIRATVKKAIETKLTINPIGFGKPLQYSLKGYRRLRVGDYRIIYSINVNTKRVEIISIRHRSIVYVH